MDKDYRAKDLREKLMEHIRDYFLSGGNSHIGRRAVGEIIDETAAKVKLMGGAEADGFQKELNDLLTPFVALSQVLERAGITKEEAVQVTKDCWQCAPDEVISETIKTGKSEELLWD